MQHGTNVARDRGTRADFYLGKGKRAEWLGSIAYDGYRDGIPANILKATNRQDYRNAVAAFLATRDDATLPNQGWPWPWDASATTDCSYWFFGGQTWDEMNGRYAPCHIDMDADKQDAVYLDTGRELIDFPDMSARRNVRMDIGSGLICISMVSKRGKISGTGAP